MPGTESFLEDSAVFPLLGVEILLLRGEQVCYSPRQVFSDTYVHKNPLKGKESLK